MTLKFVISCVLVLNAVFTQSLKVNAYDINLLENESNSEIRTIIYLIQCCHLVGIPNYVFIEYVNLLDSRLENHFDQNRIVCIYWIVIK